MLDTTEGGLLKSVEQLLSEIFIPTLSKMNHGWGEPASPQAQAVKQDFIASLEGFVSVLAGAQESLQEKVSNIFCYNFERNGQKILLNAFDFSQELNYICVHCPDIKPMTVIRMLLSKNTYKYIITWINLAE